MIAKFHYNDEMYQWERVDNTQTYKGVKIETITTYSDCYDAPRHREYKVTYPNGETDYFRINKRGGNIDLVKYSIDKKTSPLMSL